MTVQQGKFLKNNWILSVLQIQKYPLSFASLFPDTGEKYKPSSEGLICIYVSGIFDLVKWVAEMIDYIASNDG